MALSERTKTMAKNEVAKAEDKFSIVSGYEGMDDDLKAELADEMEDLDDDAGIMARQIKMPSGSVKAFSIEGETEDDTEIVKEFEGVILFTHRMNAYWPQALGSDGAAGGNPPECSSMDAKQGLNYTTGEAISCESCPHNQFKADGTGKECKNMRRVYLLRSGIPVPFLLTVPPTSIRDFNKSLARIMGGSKVPYTQMVIRFKLVNATSKSGVSYSKVAIENAGQLSPEQAKTVMAMRKQIKEQYKKVAITSDDYAAPTDQGGQQAAAQTAAPGPDGFMNVPDGIDEELPFV